MKFLLDFLFAWPLCYGKLKKANIVLNIFTNMTFLFKKMHIDKLLRAIYLITSLLSERMSPDFMLPWPWTHRLLKKRNKGMFQILNLYSYTFQIAWLLDLCEEFDLRVFYLSCAMLHYSYYSAQSIFHNCFIIFYK